LTLKQEMAKLLGFSSYAGKLVRKVGWFYVLFGGSLFASCFWL
jgi:hypothetical protein